MSQNSNANSNLYRGKNAALSTINNVDIDITSLVQEIQPAFDGEPVKRILPVRSQLTWFRLKNQHGNIVTEIIKHDEFLATVSATIYDDEGNRVSNAHASADATSDGIHGFKLVETAESRAIARALDFAGYGCQLDLKTFDEGTPDESAPTGEPAPIGNNDVQFPNEAPPTPQPGTLKGNQKVNANAASGVADISDLEESTPPVAEPKKGRGKKKEVSEPIGGEQVPPVAAPTTAAEDGAVEENTAKANEEMPADDTPATDTAESPQEPAEEVPAEEVASKDGDDSTGTQAEQGEPEEIPAEEAAPVQPEPEAEAVSEPAVEETPEPAAEPEKTKAEEALDGAEAERLVLEYIDEAIKNDSPKPTLDPNFFADGASYEDAVINGSGGKTAINNLALQLALTFLQENPKLIGNQLYPCSPKAMNYGKTFDDIANDTSEMSKVNAEAAAKTCVDLYRGDKVSAYAAALLLNAATQAQKEDANK